jgi:exonuclease SbcC
VKPLWLELENFGPYRQHAVDLTLFSKAGLFLIHGDTGAGKSTLLDAVSFALFGKGLGARAQHEHLRNRAVGPGQRTSVTLTFSLGAATWTVFRSLDYERPSRRGGTTRVPSEARLEREGGSAVAAPSKVTEEVERLLGVGHAQFERIMVLPQGEFRELLLASAQDREKLLERLFGTGLFVAVEERIKARAKGLDEDLHKLHARLASLLEPAGATGPEHLGALAREASERAERLGRDVSLAQARAAEAEAAQRRVTAAAERNAARRRWRAALAEAEVRAPSLEQTRARLERAERAEACVGDLRRAEGARAAEAEARGVSSAREGTFAEALAASADLAHGPEAEDALETEAQAALEARIALEQALSNLEAVAQEEASLLAERARVERLNAEREGLVARRSTAALALASLEGEDDPTLAAREAELSGKAQELSRRVDLAVQGAAFREELREAERALALADQRRGIARARLQEAQERLDACVTAERGALAATLASTLRSGISCPVCGSLEHPSPARTPEGTARARPEAERAVSERREQLTRAEAERAGAAGALESLRRVDPHGADEDLEALQRAAQEATDALRRAREARLREDARRQRRGTQAEAVRTLDLELVHREQTLASSREALQRRTEALEETRSRLPAERSMEAVAARLKALRATEARTRGALGALREVRSRAERALSAAEASRAAAREALSLAQARRVEGDRALAEALAGSVVADEAQARAWWLPEAERRALREALAGFEREVSTARSHLAELGAEEALEAPVEEVERDLGAARAALGAAQREAGAAVERASKLGDLELRCRAAGEAHGALERTWRVVKGVAELVDGKPDHKVRLSRYVLLEEFDQVVSCASARLEVMSDGRFQLRRRVVRTAGHEFDLVVEDAFGGAEERAVATLSGGEMFMASLSLALGLSDVVQAHAGGIRLESLFVDEGFGSLDEEALDKAVGVLEALPEGDRIVGVVSHLGELRKRIAARLEVVRTERGSETRPQVRQKVSAR